MPLKKTVRNILFLIFFISFFLPVLLTAAENPREASTLPVKPADLPLAVVPETVFDFGTDLSPGEKLVHDFIITNSGKTDLKILNVAPG